MIVGHIIVAEDDTRPGKCIHAPVWKFIRKNIIFEINGVRGTPLNRCRPGGVAPRHTAQIVVPHGGSDSSPGHAKKTVIHHPETRSGSYETASIRPVKFDVI